MRPRNDVTCPRFPCPRKQPSLVVGAGLLASKAVLCSTPRGTGVVTVLGPDLLGPLIPGEPDLCCSHIGHASLGCISQK